MTCEAATNLSNSYVGQTVGRYTFNKVIGAGGIGEVYEAFDMRLLRPVAIKVSFPNTKEESSHREHILREAQIIARVEHAHIVPIFDVLDYANSVLIVMRLVKGENLSQLMHRRNKPVDAIEALGIMRQAMLATEFAHSKGVVHSDLKPANIFISNSSETYILDFGLSALLELEKMEEGKVYGTPYYMSPEQINGSYLDARSDIYSLGIILYTLITGHHPYQGAKSIQQLLSFQLDKVPVKATRRNKSIPVKFSECVMRALEKDPRNRYHSCGEFLFGLEQSLQGVVPAPMKTEELLWDPRVNMNLPAQFSLDNSNEITATTITNLSVNGASILAPVFLRVGSKLTIEFDIREGDNYVTMSSQATVLWKDKKVINQLVEVGLSLDTLDDMDKQYLGLFVRNLLLEI